MCSPQHSAIAVDAQSSQAPTHILEAHNLSWVMCDILSHRAITSTNVDGTASQTTVPRYHTLSMTLNNSSSNSIKHGGLNQTGVKVQSCWCTFSV